MNDMTGPLAARSSITIVHKIVPEIEHGHEHEHDGPAGTRSPESMPESSVLHGRGYIFLKSIFRRECAHFILAKIYLIAAFSKTVAIGALVGVWAWVPACVSTHHMRDACLVSRVSCLVSRVSLGARCLGARGS